MKRTELWGVYAPKDGKVVSALRNNSDYGNRVYISHSDGYHIILAHLEVIFVKPNDTVKKGQIIGIMGDSGRGIPKPNKHLHLGLIPPGRPLNDLRVNCINPVPWLVDGGAYPCNTKVTYGFQHNYGAYFHEGIDFSGLEKNIIKKWKKGIEANTQRYY